MKYLILVLVFFCQGALAKEWYEGKWVFDPNLTQRNNPELNSANMGEVRAQFAKWAGKITVTPKRVKGKKAKLGVPYRVVGRNRQSVVLEVRGPAIELVKAFNPDLRKQSLRCKVVRLSSHSIVFEVPELQTIRMYLKRVQ